MDIQLRDLRRRLADRKITLELTERQGVPGQRGLRSGLRRAPAEAAPSSSRILHPLALRLLEGEFSDGDTIVVDAANGDFVFKRQEPGQSGEQEVGRDPASAAPTGA